MTNQEEGDIPVAYPPPPTSYPPQMVPPPPVGYPGNEDIDGHKPLAIETTARGEGFWEGCVAALCCCWVLECCCDG